MNPPHRFILAVTGRSHVGKDTAAAMFYKHFPALQRAAFGDSLKREFDAMYGTHTLTDNEERDRLRADLIALQDQWYDEDPLCWSRVVLATPGDQLITFPRLTEEVEAIRNAGAWLVRITASPDTLRLRMGDDYEKYRHDPTEESLDNYKHWNFVVPNDGDLAELEERVDRVAHEISKAEEIKKKSGNPPH